MKMKKTPPVVSLSSLSLAAAAESSKTLQSDLGPAGGLAGKGTGKSLAKYLAAFCLAALSPIGLDALIRWGLAVPRVRETGNPGQHGLPWREVRIPTANRRQLGAWLIPADIGAPSLVILHGWGGNAEMMLDLVKPLHGAGYTLLMVDARNHGMSDSDLFASLPCFAEDLDNAIDWFKAQPGIDQSRIGILGHSVGAAAALLTASRRQDVAAVVSLSAFAHPEAMMRRWLAARSIPYRPLGWYIVKYIERTIGHRFETIAPCEAIGCIACPVLLVHATEDTTIPLEDVHLIHAGRGHEDVDLLLLQGGHDHCHELEKAQAKILEFVAGAFEKASSPAP